MSEVILLGPGADVFSPLGATDAAAWGPTVWSQSGLSPGTVRATVRAQSGLVIHQHLAHPALFKEFN